ncbi:MAG TPA: DUF4389 domain-containing protein [Polyangia bacterium]|nr:DUF4389 domain-containing protein [Polyangia bacterium]
MDKHPVSLQVELPTRTARIHVVTRLALLLAIGAIGCSSIYWILYLTLPTFAALMILQKGEDRYLIEDGRRIVRVLRWLASAYGYLWLLTDVLPTADGNPVDLQIEVSGRPTSTSALLRLLLSIPALILVAALSMIGAVVWLMGAVSILAVERMPTFISEFLTLMLRFQFRLIAYHLSLVDRYPSLESSSLAHAHS